MERDRAQASEAMTRDPADHWQQRLCDTVRRRPHYCLLSPTWALANTLKPRTDKARRGAVIRTLNLIYFSTSLVLLLAITLITKDQIARFQAEPERWTYWLHYGLAYLLLSRVFEIFYAFLRDAVDKLEESEQSSDLRWGERVKLAMRSYVELISNFVLLYAMAPKQAWLQTSLPLPPATFTDLIWYSANVITTSGGGGFYPEGFMLKMASLLEVFSGVILLVVSFTIYTSRALGGVPAKRIAGEDRP